MRKLILRAAVIASNSSNHLSLTDAHNGLRAFTRTFASQLHIQNAGMGHATEITNQIAILGCGYAELPVSILYTNYSRQKGQASINAINIVFDHLVSKAQR